MHDHIHLVSNATLLRVDPTRTLSIVRRFVSDIRRRVKRLAAAVSNFLDAEDELGLKGALTPGMVQLARQFAFRTDADKLKAFNEWFAQQVQVNVLSVPRGTDPTRPWTADYVEAAYKRGLLNSYFGTKQKLLGDVEQNQIDFVRSAFAAPEAVSKLRLLATRSFEELKGVTGQMSTAMSRILANGLAEGRGPRDIARDMSQQLASITRKRAELIARSEVIRSHAEGQLDAFQKLGVNELNLKAEWNVVNDARLCPQCAAREGEIFTVEEARGLIPLHGNCRCSWSGVTEA